MTSTAGTPLVIVSGPAGSGKTTTSRLLAAALHGAHLDKDSLTRVFTDALLTQAGCTPGDREGEYYRTVCRPLEYQVLTAVAWDLIAAGVPVVLDAPFGVELSSTHWWAQFTQRTTEVGGRAIVVAVHTPTAALRHRLQERGAERDRGKLSDWDAFTSGLPARHPGIPAVTIDNSGGRGDLQATVHTLAHLLQTPTAPAHGPAHDPATRA